MYHPYALDLIAAERVDDLRREAQAHRVARAVRSERRPRPALTRALSRATGRRPRWRARAGPGPEPATTTTSGAAAVTR
ncbi:MAG TPA: hypothetical protein VFO65_09385 [Acidimicrobiales bacterium]|nr:hypothetical protein [Acidimicrobiales bacterium]